MEPTGEFEVSSVIKALKNKKSCGIEGISNKSAFNKCIDEGVYPDIFKTAKVVPLKKNFEIVSSVYQSSVLGQFPFLLYVNGIHLSMGKNCTMFADDTTILSLKRKGFCSIQSDMDNLSQLFCQNEVSINRDKCAAVAFGRGHPSEILILDKNVPYSNACKHLGVYVDKTLRFREHIDDVVKNSINSVA